MLPPFFDVSSDAYFIVWLQLKSKISVMLLSILSHNAVLGTAAMHQSSFSTNDGIQNFFFFWNHLHGRVVVKSVKSDDVFHWSHLCLSSFSLWSQSQHSGND